MERPEDSLRTLPDAHARIARTFAPWQGNEKTLIDAGTRKDKGDGTTAPGESRERPARDGAEQPAEDGWHREGRNGPITGQVFGDYEIGAILGEGGMGTIYRARQRSLRRRVAVKTLATQYAQDPVQRARFEIEARAASIIHSPHVVAVYAAGSHNDVAYFVMEYVEGSDLGQLLKAESGRGLGAEASARYVLQAARGLAAAGRHHIVHRDIKPSNLLLTRDDVLKIADFGISRIAGEHHLTRTGAAIGTPSYVSPEQGRGEPTDARSDLYSLGVVFYECLTGRKPFEGDSPDAVIYQHNYAEPRLPRELDPTIPEHWQAVALKLLQKDPAKRYQNADELVGDLESLSAGDLSITALFSARYGTGAEEAMRRHLGRSRRWVAPLVAAALVLAAGAAGGLLWFQSRAEARAAERQQADGLRERLRTALSSARPVPLGAQADLATLERLAGGGDPEVQRWTAKLARIEALRSALAILDRGEPVDHQRSLEAGQRLNELASLIGPDPAELGRWRAVLEQSRQEAQRLRGELTALDGSELATLGLRDRVQEKLDRLARLAGRDDADLKRWHRLFQASEERIAALKLGLAPLDAGKPLNGTAATAAQMALDELERLRGALPTPDPDVLRWRGRLAARTAQLARLRTALAPLDQAEVISETTMRRLQGDLAAYAPLVDQGDEALVRWERKLGDSQAVIGGLRQQLKALDRAGELGPGELKELGAALDRLRPLVAGDDAEARRWSAALALAQRQLAAWQADLAPLSAPEPPTLAQRQRAETALAELDRRGCLREDDKLACSKRLIDEQTRLAELRSRLADLVGRNRPSQELVEGILLLGRLAGDQDPDYRRWYDAVVVFVRLRERLLPLAEARPLPDKASELLGQFAEIAGEDYPEVLAWRAKLARVEALQGELAVLDRKAPLPPQAAARVEELARLIGPFPQLEAWRSRIARVGGLVAGLDRDLGPAAARWRPEAEQDLAAIAAEIGEDAPEVRRWRDRRTVLEGPGRPAWASAYAVDQLGPRALAEIPGQPALSLAFRYVPPGTFAMGSPADEPGRKPDEGPVQVTLSQGLWMAETEVSQALWRRIMGTSPSLSQGDERPVERVSWDDTQRFCAELRRLHPGLAVRLPSEAEWERACRAGDTGQLFGLAGPLPADQAALVGWSRRDGEGAPHESGRRQPNRLGLHDLHGNVWEWVEDRYGAYSPVPISDPVGFGSDRRVARGGSWGDEPASLRAANRLALDPGLRSPYLGFRLCLGAGRP